jgi:hypothetical protein
VREITYLRYRRTRQSNRIRRQIVWLASEPAKYSRPDGLPSWWDFWSDALKRDVRELVQIGRALEVAEKGQAE